MAFGKFLSVQIGIDFSGGSCKHSIDLYSGQQNTSRCFLIYLRRAVGLGDERNDNLDVAFRTQRAGLEQRFAIVNASSIHVDTGVHIIQRIRHAVQASKKSVVEEVLRFRSNAVLICHHVHLLI